MTSKPKDRLAEGMKHLAAAVDAMVNLSPDNGSTDSAIVSSVRDKVIALHKEMRSLWGVMS